MTLDPNTLRAIVEPLSGHWDSPDAEMIAAYAGKTRGDLMHGNMTDFLLANRQYLAGRTDLDLVAWQTAAKERIRWLSVQLALQSSAILAMAEENGRMRKLTSALERVACTDLFSGRLCGFDDPDDAETAEEEEAWRIIASEIEPLRRQADAAAGIKLHRWVRDE